MKYLLLCCFDEKQWAALPQIRRDAIMQEYGTLLESLDRSGQHLATGKLRPVATAATVRSHDGRAVVSDGPFAETKEQLGGYHLLECRDADEAIAIAKRFPTLAEGGVVEVRALEYCTP